MRLNKLNVQRILKVEGVGELSGENSQLISIDNIEQYLDLSQLISLNLSQNHLKEIEPVFTRMTQLKTLNLQMNHLRFITYLENCQSLQFLDLSTNRIIRADKLSSCKNLRIIDLSMNYIEEMEDLNLPYLEQLYLQGNKLQHLPSFENLPRLRFLDVSKNDLGDVNPILQPKGLNYLEKLKCAYNKMPSQYLEDFCFILGGLPNLLEIDLVGNEMTINPLYRSSILTAKRLRVIDGLEVDDTTIEQIQKLKNTENFEQAIVDTNKDFLLRLQKENESKQKAKKMLQDQIDRIDDMFSQFQQKTEKEQMYFMEYVAIMEKRYRQGDKIQLDADTIKLWQLRITQNEAELKKKIQIQNQIKEHQKDVFLQKEINGLTLREKLYDIAMNDPQLWRDLKSKELDQVYKEERRNDRREEEELQKRMGTDQSSANYGNMENEMRNNIAEKIQNKLQLINEYSRDEQQIFNDKQSKMSNSQVDQQSFSDGKSLQADQRSVARSATSKQSYKR